MSRRALFPLLACVALLTACGSGRQSDDRNPAPLESKTTLRVDNNGFLDMTVYVLDGSQRVRLGIANGNRSTELTIPPYLVRGVTSLRFLCDPVGGNRAPVSDQIVVEPGDRVTLLIPAS
jgi:hypothetical protein